MLGMAAARHLPLWIADQVRNDVGGVACFMGVTTYMDGVCFVLFSPRPVD